MGAAHQQRAHQTASKTCLHLKFPKYIAIARKLMMKGFANNSLRRKENCFNYCFGENNYPTSSLPRDERRITQNITDSKKNTFLLKNEINQYFPSIMFAHILPPSLGKQRRNLHIFSFFLFYMRNL